MTRTGRCGGPSKSAAERNHRRGGAGRRAIAYSPHSLSKPLSAPYVQGYGRYKIILLHPQSNTAAGGCCFCVGEAWNYRRNECGHSGPIGRSEARSEEHTSELQSRGHLVCRLLHEKKNVHIM